jgi:hypothetical protein
MIIEYNEVISHHIFHQSPKKIMKYIRSSSHQQLNPKCHESAGRQSARRYSYHYEVPEAKKTKTIRILIIGIKSHAYCSCRTFDYVHRSSRPCARSKFLYTHACVRAWRATQPTAPNWRATERRSRGPPCVAAVLSPASASRGHFFLPLAARDSTDTQALFYSLQSQNSDVLHQHARSSAVKKNPWFW